MTKKRAVSSLPNSEGLGNRPDDSDEEKFCLSSLSEHEPSDSDDDDKANFWLLEEEPITLPDDVFGSFVLVCVKFHAGKGNRRHATFSVLLIVFTLFIQAAFCFAMIPAISKDEVGGKVQPARDFFARNVKTHGAEYLSRVCAGEEWTWQESVIDDYSKYTKRVESKLLMFLGPKTSKGLVFGTIALFLWTASWVKAIREWGRYMLIITAHAPNDCQLPGDRRANAKGNHQSARTCDSDEKSDRKCAVFSPQNWEDNCCLKVVVVVTGLIRLIISVGLGLYGAKFLCHTDNLKDFILNSVALVFVIEVPALVQAAFASSTEQKDIERYNSQVDTQKPNKQVWRGLSGLLEVFVGVSFVFFAYWRWLKPFNNELELDIMGKLCNQSYSSGG